MRSRSLVIFVAAILLLIAASRAFRLNATVTEVTVDEVWSIWQGLGTPDQIIRWTPYDWPPGYYLALGGWRVLVGIQPIALRWPSLLAFVIGAAALYRVARRLRGDGIIAMLVYAAFGYLIFMSTELRGYILLLALYPLTIWLALRYFDHPRWQRALPLALVMASMVYISLTSIPAMACLVLFTLIVYRQRVWRWWLPGGLAVLLALPELLQKASIVVARTQAEIYIPVKPFFDALVEMYTLWSGNIPWLWLALFVTAVAAVIRMKHRSIGIALLIWSLLPIALYVTNGVLGFFNVRYAWWVMTGIALLLGVGLSALPKPGRAVTAGVFGVLALLPIPLNHYQIPQPPLSVNFAWLRQNFKPGDVMLIDPNCSCGAPEVFDYYTHIYFPEGIPFVTSPGDYRRIWYVTGASGATKALKDVVNQGRTAEIFVGPPEGLFRLYEAPPNPTGILYANGIRFDGIDVLDKIGLPIYHEGDPLHLRLWWSAESPPSLDYSVSLYFIDSSGNIVFQEDGPPQVTPKETSQWQPDQVYVEDRTLQLPFPLSTGHYQLMMAVYWYGDGVRIKAPGVDASGALPTLDFTISSWGH